MTLRPGPNGRTIDQMPPRPRSITRSEGSDVPPPTPIRPRLESTMKKSSPELLVTLVHGTFASERGWAERSLLRTRIEKKFGDGACRTFGWSGRNSIPARREGAEALAEHVAALRTEHPGTRQVLIAHSHGGNLALHALKDERASEAVAGVVALGTPFLYATARNTRVFCRRVFRLSSFALRMAGLLLFCGSISAAIGVLLWLFDGGFGRSSGGLSSVLVGFAVIAALVGPSLIVYDQLQKLAKDRGKGRALIRRIKRSREDTVRSLKLPETISTPVLCVEDSADEAYLLLLCQNLLTHVPIFFMGAAFALPIISGSAALALWAPLLYGVERLPFNLDPVQTFSMAVRASVVALFAGPLMVVACGGSIWLIQAQWWGFGSGKPETYFWCNVRAARFPPGPTTVRYLPVALRRRMFGLRHCEYYNDSRVVGEVVRWLPGPSGGGSDAVSDLKAPSPPQPRAGRSPATVATAAA